LLVDGVEILQVFPEGVANVVFLVKLRQALATLRQAGRIVQQQGRLEIGLDDIFRRRQDVRDEILAQDDPAIDRAIDLQLAERADACPQDGNASQGHDQAEQIDCSTNAQLHGGNSQRREDGGQFDQRGLIVCH
jgi:hypothetical protein